MMSSSSSRVDVVPRLQLPLLASASREQADVDPPNWPLLAAITGYLSEGWHTKSPRPPTSTDEDDEALRRRVREFREREDQDADEDRNQQHGRGAHRTGFFNLATTVLGPRWAWVTSDLVLIWLCFLVDYTLMSMVIPIFPLLGASPVITGWLFASKSIAQIVSLVTFMPFLVDRVPKRYVVGAGLLVEILSLLLFCHKFDYLLFFAARSLSGVGSALVISCGQAHLKDVYEKNAEELALAMGVAATGIIGGVCVGPVFGGVLFAVDPRSPWAVLAAVDFLVLLFLAFGKRADGSGLMEEVIRSSRLQAGMSTSASVALASWQLTPFGRSSPASSVPASSFTTPVTSTSPRHGALGSRTAVGGGPHAPAPASAPPPLQDESREKLEPIPNGKIVPAPHGSAASFTIVVEGSNPSSTNVEGLAGDQPSSASGSSTDYVLLSDVDGNNANGVGVGGPNANESGGLASAKEINGFTAAVAGRAAQDSSLRPPIMMNPSYRTTPRLLQPPPSKDEKDSHGTVRTAQQARRRLDADVSAPVMLDDDEVPSLALLKHPLLLKLLLALFIANGSIGCLSASIGGYAIQQFHFDTAQTGFFYLYTSIPSCLFSALAGPIGNSLGRRETVIWGLFIQGFFTMLGPKSSLAVEAVSLCGLGIGMGLIDGTVPALLGSAADAAFRGRRVGKVYVLSNIAIQLGFILGPILGNSLIELWGFWRAMLLAGGIMVLYAPVFVVGRDQY